LNAECCSSDRAANAKMMQLLLQRVHWLPLEQSIYKTAVITFMPSTLQCRPSSADSQLHVELNDHLALLLFQHLSLSNCCLELAPRTMLKKPCSSLGSRLIHLMWPTSLDSNAMTCTATVSELQHYGGTELCVSLLQLVFLSLSQ